MLDVDTGQQVRDEVVFLMQVDVLKTGYLQQELIEADEVPHVTDNLVLLQQIILFDHVLAALEVEGQLLLILRGNVRLVK